VLDHLLLRDRRRVDDLRVLGHSQRTNGAARVAVVARDDAVEDLLVVDDLAAVAEL
jgi:hypothetical protein